MTRTVQRKDYATGMGFFILLVLFTAPIWAVIAAGLFAPLMVAGFIAIIPLAVIRSWFKK
jgi:hypothetical protein